ncbi:hypothetical protein AB0H57_24500 [Micromonospora sp. NPDC050686]|uniref:hypothetical protein n=1 Tax=Micromonospora sp. NPDC050686 TaxID=3154631 RepID=UPI0033EAABFA
MTAPYLAPSLAVLRDEINRRWPGRDKTSDGWIGDARHRATRSDHNPNERGSVDAIDIDEDGISFAVVFAAIKRHPSARYVIYERRLYHRLRGWRPEPYGGVNPHDKHVHVSIDQTRAAEQDRRPWGLLEDDMPLTPADANTVWAAQAREYVDQDGNKIRDDRTAKDILWSAHATAVRLNTEMKQLRTEVTQLRTLLQGVAERLSQR